MIQAEAVLCEDSRTVGIYLYSGDDLVRFTTQPLPVPMTEEAFEEVRPEWEQAWSQTQGGPSH